MNMLLENLNHFMLEMEKKKVSSLDLLELIACLYYNFPNLHTLIAFVSHDIDFIEFKDHLPTHAL